MLNLPTLTKPIELIAGVPTNSQKYGFIKDAFDSLCLIGGKETRLIIEKEFTKVLNEHHLTEKMPLNFYIPADDACDINSLSGEFYRQTITCDIPNSLIDSVFLGPKTSDIIFFRHNAEIAVCCSALIFVNLYNSHKNNAFFMGAVTVAGMGPFDQIAAHRNAEDHGAFYEKLSSRNAAIDNEIGEHPFDLIKNHFPYDAHVLEALPKSVSDSCNESQDPSGDYNESLSPLLPMPNYSDDDNDSFDSLDSSKKTRLSNDDESDLYDLYSPQLQSPSQNGTRTTSPNSDAASPLSSLSIFNRSPSPHTSIIDSPVIPLISSITNDDYHTDMKRIDHLNPF